MAHLFNCNVLGTLRVTQALLPSMTQSESELLGKVINISSVMGSIEQIRLMPNYIPYFTSYNTSKAAQNMMTSMFAREFREKKSITAGECKRKMTFLALSPGLKRTTARRLP
jgi:NAD(P)-dependent dehydrogenase (short-subunit alcohol dehydrogenase family)